jgi:hypothetical protein
MTGCGCGSVEKEHLSSMDWALGLIPSKKKKKEKKEERKKKGVFHLYSQWLQTPSSCGIISLNCRKQYLLLLVSFPIILFVIKRNLFASKSWLFEGAEHIKKV